MPWLLYPRERAPGIHWIRGWVGHRAILDTVVKREKFPGPDHPAHSSVLYHTSEKYKMTKSVHTDTNIVNCFFTWNIETEIFHQEGLVTVLQLQPCVKKM
jgi:hypothetical protein